MSKSGEEVYVNALNKMNLKYNAPKYQPSPGIKRVEEQGAIITADTVDTSYNHLNWTIGYEDYNNDVE